MTQHRQPQDDDELILLADIAHRYYEQDMTQEQIARQLRVSRSNVSRMLKEARQRGLVEIRIHHPLQTVPQLQETLRERFGLSDCLVLSNWPPTDPEADHETAHKIGALAARYLQEHVPNHSIVGVGWGNTIWHVVTSGYLRKKVGMSVVQVMGSVGGGEPDIDGIEIASRLGRTLGGRVYYLHAPMIVTDAAVRAGLMRDQHIRRSLEMARRAQTLVLSVGAISRRSGLYRAGYLNDADLDYIQGHGVVGDLAGVHYSRSGDIIHLELNDRMISISHDIMRQIPLRIGVSWGTAKGLANLGAARSRLLNVLITDETAAREMLALADEDGLDTPGAVAATATTAESR
ncbi:MAG TPA: sugar-binding domain-containing protein [Thermomicrobiales bacterium]